MMRVVILALIEMFDICYNIYQKAFKPMYPIFKDILKLFKEVFILIYENIIKTIYLRVLKPSALYIYNRFNFYKERYKEFDKEEFKTKLVNYKNEIIEYFKSHTSEEITNDIKFNCKLIYSCISTIVKERWKSKKVKDFQIKLLEKDHTDRINKDKVLKLSLKITKDNITITYWFARIDNDVDVTYHFVEDLATDTTNKPDEDRSHINARIYSN